MAFKRSFEHIEGNWPCYIYLKVPFTKKFCKLLEIIVLDSFNKNKIIESRFISEKSFHISLSRSFVLRHHQIQPFLNRLHSILPSQLLQLYFELFCEYFILYNDNKTRKFLCIPIEDRNSLISKIIEAIDIVLLEFQQQKYYEIPKYHISIGSEPCPEDNDVDSDDNLTEQIISISSIPDSNKYTRIFSNILDDQNQDSDNEDDDEEEEDEENNGNSLLSTIIKITELCCKIGNDIYRHEENGFRQISLK